MPEKAGEQIIDFCLFTPDNIPFGESASITINFTGFRKENDPEKAFKYYSQLCMMR